MGMALDSLIELAVDHCHGIAQSQIAAVEPGPVPTHIAIIPLDATAPGKAVGNGRLAIGQDIDRKRPRLAQRLPGRRLLV
ncbi:hypothetical protein D3C81_2049000 [compost metagenome]